MGGRIDLEEQLEREEQKAERRESKRKQKEEVRKRKKLEKEEAEARKLWELERKKEEEARKLRELERKQKIQSFKEISTPINLTVASTSNSEISSTLSSSTVEYRLAKIYERQLMLCKAAKADDVDSILNFFYQSDETLEALAPSSIYQTVDSSNTLLHVAASFDSKATVELIVDYLIGPSILTTKNSKGDTALHVAAKAGHFFTVKALIYPPVEYSYLFELKNEEGITSLREADYDRSLFLGLMNAEGNTALHEALVNGQTCVAHALIEADPQVSFCLNNESKTPLYLAAEAGSLICVKFMLESTEAVNPAERLKGKSPIHAAILSAGASERTATDILTFLLGEEPKFIHGRDEEGRTVLHLAASVGYPEAVDYLLKNFSFIAVERDNRGAFPIHMAAMEGHVSVIQKLLPYCPDPWKMLESNDKNMLHWAAESGAFNVVRDVLRNPELKMLLNQSDKDGNTPLHLATINWHHKIVSAFTWDDRVDLTLVNNERQTAFDAARNHMERNSVASFRKRLTWVALEAAGAARAPPTKIMNVYKKSTVSKPLDTDYYKDKVNTLLLVSTFVVTATFAAGFTMPGGFKSSDPDEGTATLLGRNVFGIFIFCDTIAMYSSILAAVFLLWGQLGDAYDLVLMMVRFALPLMGISLIMMNLAFIAGVYLVVGELSWLGIAVLILGALFLVVLSLFFFPLFLPIWSRNSILGRMLILFFQPIRYLTGGY